MDTSTCMLYEMYNVERTTDGFVCTSAALFDLNSENYKRPAGYTSADAAGQPIYPGKFLINFYLILTINFNHD